MKIGIIGAGNMGAGLGKLWAKSGHEGVFSYSREKISYARLQRPQGQPLKQAPYKSSSTGIA